MWVTVGITMMHKVRTAALPILARSGAASTRYIPTRLPFFRAVDVVPKFAEIVYCPILWGRRVLTPCLSTSSISWPLLVYSLSI